MSKLVDIEALSPDRSSILPGTQGLARAVRYTREKRRLLSRDELEIGIFEPARESAVTPRYAQILLPGKILRLVFDDGTFREYRIERRNRAYERGDGSVVYARGLWEDLKGSAVSRSLDSGDVDYDFTISGVSPAEALSRIMASAPAPFVAGTVTGLTSAQQAQKVSLQIAGGMSHLDAITALCRTLDPVAEWDVVYDPFNDRYRIDLVSRIEHPGNRIMRGPAYNLIVNRISQLRETNSSKYFSRLVPLVGSSPEQTDIGEAYFDVVEMGINVKLAQNAIPYKNFAKGLWFGIEGDWHRITGTTPPNILRFSTPVLHPKCRFATNLQGGHLTYLALDEAEKIFGGASGEATRVEVFEGSPFPNLLREAGVSDDFSTLEGWTAFGPVVEGVEQLPALEIASDPERTRFGTSSLKVAAGPGQGVISDPIATDAPYLFMWLGASLESGTLGLKLVDANGVEHPLGESVASTNATTFAGLAAGAIDDYASPVRVKIEALEAGTVMWLDAVTLCPTGSSHVEWQPVMGPRDAFLRGVALLQKEGGTTHDYIKGEIIDLGVLSPEEYDTVRLGGMIHLQDGFDPATRRYELDLKTRIVYLEREYTAGSDSFKARIELDELRTDLIDQLAGAPENPVIVPPAPSKSRIPPVLFIESTQDDFVSTHTLRCVRSRETGTPLTSYEIYCNHKLVDGKWVLLEQGAYELWQNSESIVDHFAGHTLVIPRPHPLYPPAALSIYVVDRITGLRSAPAVLSADPAVIKADPRVGQSDLPDIVSPFFGTTGKFSVGRFWLDVYDPSLAMGEEGSVLEFAIKYPQDADFQPWVQWPVLPGDGSLNVGTFGVDASLVRYMHFVLAPKPHDSYLQWRLGLKAPDGTIVYVQSGSETYDSDREPEFANAAFSLGAWNSAQNGWEVRFAYRVDDDARAAKIGISASAYPTDRTLIQDSAFTLLSAARDHAGFLVGYLAADTTRHYTAIATENADGTGRRTVEPLVQTLTGAPAPTEVDLTPGSVKAEHLEKAAQTYASTVVFSATAYNRVAWTAGALRFADGSSQSIAAGATSNFSGTRYIYWDPAEPGEFEDTGTYSSAVSNGRLLVCIAWAASETAVRASFVPGVGRLGLSGEDIAPNSIKTNHLAANSVTAAKIDTVSLSTLFLQVGGAAEDINGGVTLIDGGRIDTDTLVAKRFSIGNDRVKGDSTGIWFDLGVFEQEEYDISLNWGKDAYGDPIFRIYADNVEAGVISQHVLRLKGYNTAKLESGPNGVVASRNNGVALYGEKIGFYDAIPVTKPNIIGSRGGNSALTSLLIKLSLLGLITDSTT